MSIIAILQAELNRLEEELHQAGCLLRWDEKTHLYYRYLKEIFHDRR